MTKNNVSEELNLYQQESKSCALSIKLETPVRVFPEVLNEVRLLETLIYNEYDWQDLNLHDITTNWT